MKAVYLHDFSVNIKTTTDEYKAVAVPVLDKSGAIKDWLVPKGTVIEGNDALLRVACGMAAPFDEECANACGLTPTQLKQKQRECLSAMAGIRGEKDYELFMAEVIDGYDLERTTPTETVYKPGKNWARYQAAIEARKAED